MSKRKEEDTLNLKLCRHPPVSGRDKIEDVQARLTKRKAFFLGLSTFKPAGFQTSRFFCSRSASSLSISYPPHCLVSVHREVPVRDGDAPTQSGSFE